MFGLTRFVRMDTAGNLCRCDKIRREMRPRGSWLVARGSWRAGEKNVEKIDARERHKRATEQHMSSKHQATDPLSSVSTVLPLWFCLFPIAQEPTHSVLS
jgi:hypothetical protein